MAKHASLPRATWANLESGAANPTLAVLDRVATAFQVTIEELVAAARSEAHHYPKPSLPVKMRGVVAVRKLLPDPIPGMDIDRIELVDLARAAVPASSLTIHELASPVGGSAPVLATP
jgi:XRE family transcriptional regulator, regulator of sulfur utilization